MLKKISFETKRLADINALHSVLLIAEFDFNGNGRMSNISNCLSLFYKKNFTLYKDWKIIASNKYGKAKNDENLIEQKYVEILTILSIFFFSWCYWYRKDVYFKEEYGLEIMTILKRYERRLPALFPEFKLLDPLWKGNFSKLEFSDYLPQYTLTSTKPSYDNLKNVPKEKAQPIALLLNPNLKTSTEIMGAITEVYKQIEKISQDQLTHLSKEDKTIFTQSQNYLKCLANKADIRHKNESVITKIAIKELSILFGTVAALLQKLLTKP